MLASSLRSSLALALLAAGAGLPVRAVVAQETGTVEGTVINRVSSRPIRGLPVDVVGIRTAVTDRQGHFILRGVPVGEQIIRFRWPGYERQEVTVAVTTGGPESIDVVLNPAPIQLGDLIVTGVSLAAQRVLDAPAAVVAAEPARIQEMASTGQTPLVLAEGPGVHLAQSSVYDFNLNVRGFNSPLNRRVLVLVDRRDVSVPLLDNQEWTDVLVTERAGEVELVKGPGSALYGANAFNGVLAIRTPSVIQSPGALLQVGAGGLGSFRADGRYGWVSRDYHWGIRVRGGYSRGETFDKSRTNIGDLEREYSVAVDSSTVNTPLPGYEFEPLRGQTKSTPFAAPGEATGTPDPLETYSGSARVDYYRADGSMITAEGGLSRLTNPVTTSSLGRSQIYKSLRPWARLAWSAPSFQIMGYYTGRNGEQTALATGTPTTDNTGRYYLEGLYRGQFASGRGRTVIGASAKVVAVDSKGTVLAPEADNRSDEYYGVFGQVDFDVTRNVTLIAAARVDDGNLLDTQFSPKLGLVVVPGRNQALRLTFNRAFLTPSVLQRFLQFPAGPPVDLTLLEASLRASPLGPALMGVPDGELYTNSAAVPALVLGNPTLKPEQINGVELGYKGQLGRLFFSTDVYYSEIQDFATGILPGANSSFGPWVAPDVIPEPAKTAVEQATEDAVGVGITNLSDGSTAIVLSLGNAGTATEWGVEVGAGLQVRPDLRFDLAYAYYDFKLEQNTFLPGDSILPNTPPHRASAAVTYQGTFGLRARAALRFSDSYRWLSGVYGGEIPTTTTVDLNVSYEFSQGLILGLVATNLLNQQRFHIYGGSIVGRRVLGTLTWSP